MELRFGEYGGQYVSEVLMPSLKELEKAYKEYKDDPEFKEELDYYLKKYAGRETPDWSKIESILNDMVGVLHEELGWFNKEELNNTPRRVMNFYKEWYECSKWEDVRLFENGDGEFGCDKVYDQLIVLRDISISSMCSHHMLPFVGKCHIVYLPGDKVVGVSKLARIVKKFASKPQIQEQLTNEISEFILNEMSCKFVLVIIEAQHMCMKIRGVKESESKMVTSAIRWNNRLISDDKIEGLKQEALKLIYR